MICYGILSISIKYFVIPRKHIVNTQSSCCMSPDGAYCKFISCLCLPSIFPVPQNMTGCMTQASILFLRSLNLMQKSLFFVLFWWGGCTGHWTHDFMLTMIKVFLNSACHWNLRAFHFFLYIDWSNSSGYRTCFSQKQKKSTRKIYQEKYFLINDRKCKI